jgi:hypothetical protein
MNPEGHPLLGKWRITSMALWDAAFIELLGPGHIQFDAEGGGEFTFGAVQGGLDCHFGRDDVAFTSAGSDEMDHAWATVMLNSRRMAPSPVRSASTSAMNPPSPPAAGSFSADC